MDENTSPILKIEPRGVSILSVEMTRANFKRKICQPHGIMGKLLCSRSEEY
jgi:hypothetical protein